MKVPTTATCGRDPPDHQLQSNIPRAVAWHLCEFKVRWCLPTPPQAWQHSQMCWPHQRCCWWVCREQYSPQILPKEHPLFLGTWQHGKNDRRGRDRSLLPDFVLPRDSSAGASPSWPVLTLPLAGGAKCVAAKIRIANNCYWAECILTWDRRQLVEGKGELFCYFPQQNSRFC